MKRRNLTIVMILVISGFFAIQSCTKDEYTEPVIYKAVVPVATSPIVAEVLPFTGTGQTINLAWAGTATSAVTWDVYFGDTEEPELLASGVTTTNYSTSITAGGTYYWQVGTKDENGIVTMSPVWDFHANTAPTVPVLITPANNATKVSKTATLNWTSTDAEHDHITYDVFLGTTATPGAVASGITAETYTPTLAYNTTYYWQIVAHDEYGGVSKSAVNKFTTDVQQPDYNVFNGTASELSPSTSATALKNVTVQRLGTSNSISLFLPLADAMVSAGWGTVYKGSHAIIIDYNPTTLAVTSTKQAWLDSFIDPTEMGPMALTVKSGSIDATKKTITIVWTVSGNAYWGGDYDMKATTYTMK